MAIVAVKNVSKAYLRGKQEIPVLNDISLDVEEGAFLALMGPSGSGKTTLLNLIAGIDRPDSGEIIVADTDIGRLSESELANWRSQHVGFIFQFYNLMPVLTAFENVELPLLLTNLSKKKRREHVASALDIVGLSDRVKHYPNELSGGQEQRVAIARAVVTDPTIVVADEPTGALDSKTGTEVMALFDELHDQGLTIIVVTHDPIVAQRSKRVVTLHDGKVASDKANGSKLVTAMLEVAHEST